jgi:hypothetical protein
MKIKDITGEYLFEMPEMIGNEDFGLDSDTINTEMAKSILNDKETIKVGEINNLPLYKCGNKYAIIVMEKKKPTIKYLVKYEVNHIDMLGIDAAQQVAVWRERGSEYSNIASKMFFDYIPKGMTFFKSAKCTVTKTDDALTYGYPFYQNSGQQTIIKILYADLLAKKVFFVLAFCTT